jgi:hypothetical protein
MHISIPADLEAFVKDRAVACGFGRVEDYVCSLIQQDEDLASFAQLSEQELSESLAMLDRGMADVAAGRTMSVEEAKRRTEEKLGLQMP